MRRLSRRLAPFSATTRGTTPYQVVLRAVEKDGRGLLAAAEVFKQFQRYYHTFQQEGTGASTTLLPGKPLTNFCGRAEDVEPMTMLLLKVLCDLQRLEEMRFLFTQCLLEMDQQTPSVELFNVYLLAISMTDTFNQYEVENLVELQRAKMIVPDVVTKLSMFLLYLRLGHHRCVDWWPTIRAEAQAVMDEGAVSRYPLLPLRLQHCFQALLRVHYDPAVIHECLQLLHRAAPERVTPSLVLPYLLLSALNMAAPPAAVVEALRMVDETPPATATEPSLSSSSPSFSGADGERGPLLSSETTVFRLLAKCAKYGDADSAAYLRAYLDAHRAVSIIEPENRPLASLLYVQALTKAGRVRSALRVLETEVPAPHHRPGERPKLFLQSRRLSLLSTDPVSNVVAALVPLVAALHVEDPALTLVAEKAEAGSAEERAPVPVTAITLNLVVAACEHAGGAVRAEEVLRLFPRYEAAPNTATYVMLLRVYAATAAVDGVLRLPSMQREMREGGVAVDAAWLHAALTVALNAHDTGAALQLLDMHLAHRTVVDTKHGVRLLRELATAADVAGMRRALRLLRATKTTVDPRSVALCAAVLKNLGVSTSVLYEDGA